MSAITNAPVATIKHSTDIIKRDKKEGFEQKTGMLPLELNAENGAKLLLIGDFFEQINIPCPDCDNDAPDCETCSGYGEITQQVMVQWTTIKDIYKKIVEHYTKQNNE